MKVISYNGIEKKIDKIAELGGFDPDTQEELKSFIEKAVFDAEPIVRCKDCAFWQDDWLLCSADPDWHYCSMNDANFRAGEYCSRGERKESDETIHGARRD